MKKKFIVKFIAVISALVMIFSLAACGGGGGGGGGLGSYGSLDDFFKDFFDDWDDVGSDTPEVDFSEIYGEPDENKDYYDASFARTFNPAWGTHIYEAENSEFGGSDGKPKIEANGAASGGMNLGYINAGTYMKFTVTSEVKCTVLLRLCIATDSGKRARDLFYINYEAEGGERQTLKLGKITVNGNSWTNFMEKDIGEIELEAGVNTVTINSFGGFNLDYALLVPNPDLVTGERPEPPVPPEPTPVEKYDEVYGSYTEDAYVSGAVVDKFDPRFGPYIYEGEDATISGECSVSTENNQASGGKYLSGFRNGATATFNIASEKDCRVLVRVASTNSDKFVTTSANKIMDMKCNGVKLLGGDEETFVGNGGWLGKPLENTVGELVLKKGNNSVTVTSLANSDENAYNFDYMLFIPEKSEVGGEMEDLVEDYVTAPEQWESVYGHYAAAEYVDGFNTVGGVDSSFDPVKGAHLYEAEKAKLGEGLSVEGAGNTKPNASGMQQVGGFDGEKRTLTFEFKSKVEYTALLTVCVTGNSGGSKLLSDHFEVKYNYAHIAKIPEIKLDYGNWSSDVYKENYLCEVKLRAGANRIELSVANAGWPDSFCLDYIALYPKQSDVVDDSPSFAPDGSDVTRIEAEDCKLLNAKIEDGVDGVTSGKNIGNSTPKTIVKFKIEVTQAGTFALKVRGAMSDEDADRKQPDVDYANMQNRLKIAVGENILSPDMAVEFPASNWWKTYQTFEMGNVTLEAGEHTVTVYFLAGCCNVDYFELVPVAA